jgi:hypothetical protein
MPAALCGKDADCSAVAVVIAGGDALASEATVHGASDGEPEGSLGHAALCLL